MHQTEIWQQISKNLFQLLELLELLELVLQLDQSIEYSQQNILVDLIKVFHVIVMNV